MGYSIPPTGIQSVSEVDSMIRQCFQTLCKEWMIECHWYCDSTKAQTSLLRCKECLSWRGQQCMDCFEM
ncbi:hypothetical protein RB195_013939 [Necator americanus]|nr:hypothetical protein NECAME_03047 [Necator americanus]ETN77875.1 hypothetical protein NECAME_03047 [Necator americanus]